MAGLIVSRQAKQPYYIQEIGLNIYSMEELAYFLYDYIAIVERDFFTRDLAEYIGDTLGQKSIAQRLLELRDRHGTVGDMTMLIAKTSGYYSESELLTFQHLVDARKNADEIVLLKEKADKLADIGQYVSAIRTYQECLKKQDAQKAPDFCGNVWYQLGCIYSRLLQLEEAQEAFLSSLALVENRTCMQKLFFVYRLQENDEAAAQMKEQWNLSEGILKEWDNIYCTVEEEMRQTLETEPISLADIKEQYRREHGYRRG